MVDPASPRGLVGVHPRHAPVPAVPPGGEGVHRAGTGAGLLAASAGEVALRQIPAGSLQVRPDRPEPDSRPVAGDEDQVVSPHPPDPRHARRVLEVDAAVPGLVADDPGPDAVALRDPADEVFCDSYEDPVAGRPPPLLPEVEFGVLRAVVEAEDDVGPAIGRGAAHPLRNRRRAADEPGGRDGARDVRAELTGFIKRRTDDLPAVGHDRGMGPGGEEGSGGSSPFDLPGGDNRSVTLMDRTIYRGNR